MRGTRARSPPPSAASRLARAPPRELPPSTSATRREPRRRQRGRSLGRLPLFEERAQLLLGRAHRTADREVRFATALVLPDALLGRTGMGHRFGSLSAAGKWKETEGCGRAFSSLPAAAA